MAAAPSAGRSERSRSWIVWVSARSLLDKGVTWRKGKVFFDTRAVYEFDLLPETGHRMPAFINLQQYYFEHCCIDAATKTGLVDLRWQEEVTGLERTNDGVLLDHRHTRRRLPPQLPTG